MRPLWRWAELCRALGAPQTEGPDVSGVSIDTRTLSPGDLFVALPGDPGPRFNPGYRSDRDGHDYVPAARAAGAAGVVVHRPVAGEGPQLVVEDTLDALWTLGAAARARSHAIVYAVTGSSGKTTAKTLLHAALARLDAGEAFASRASLNNHLGVPLSLSRFPAGARFGVFELGTNHPGEIAPLSRLVRPQIALVLNVHPAHAEYFPSLADIETEKLSIYEGLCEISRLVVHCDLYEAARALPARSIEPVTYGRAPGASVRLVGYDGTTARIATPDGRIQARVPGGGEHRAMTLTAVVACLWASGQAPDAAVDLDDALVPAGRGTRREIPTATGSICLVDDSYNANPETMAGALRTLVRMPGPAVAVLGEMLELGTAGADYHRALAPLCSGLAGVVCVGSGTRPLFDALDDDQQWGFYDSAADIDLEDLATRLAGVRSVLVKGSNRVFWVHGFVDRLAGAMIAR